MKFKSRHLIYTALCAVSFAAVAQADTDKPYELKLSYDHGDRSGDGKKFDDNFYSATLTQKLGEGRSQYFMLGYDDASLNKGAHTDSDNGSLAYGQIWSSSHPGLIFNLGAYVNKGWNDYNGSATVGDNFVHSASGGITGGLTQVLPVSQQDIFAVGSNFSLFYSWADNTPGAEQGTNASAFPFAQYTRIVTPQLSAYVRLSAALSTTDVTLNSGGVLYSPAVGLDYSMGDYKLGAKFTRDLADNYNGARFGVSLSKSF